ncbi:MAG: TRAP transporter substrate-binding protein, partial [Simplicispira sp.]|nr:TRAP transporter substrate-binding protein [Simplicispira sp.]
VSGSALAATFKVAVGDAQGSAQWEMASKFKAAFEAKTGGKHKAELFPNEQLGGETTVNSAPMGTLDFSVLAVNNITPFSPSVGVLTLPYVIQSAEEAKKLVTGDVGKELSANTVRDAGVRIVGWTFTGFSRADQFEETGQDAGRPQGLKIRVPKNEIMIASYQAWGINPTPMARVETFTALQQRVVDGQDNPYITVSSMKFNEVQKYITNIRYVFSSNPSSSARRFKKQPADVQKAILDAGASHRTQLQVPA